MKPRALLLIAGVLSLNVAAAHAERWEDTKHGSLIDVDSIRKAPDGLVHYNQRSKGSNFTSKYAFDCKKSIAYYAMTGPDWKSKGSAIKPGTMGGELMNFVCSRVR
jgi:hypothetical protein